MMIATLAIVAAGIAIVVLLVQVADLNRRLRRLAAEVQDLRDQSPVPMPPSGDLEPVAVITGLLPVGDPEPSAHVSTGRVVSVTLAGPMIKAVALSHGVRRALGEERRMRIAYAFRKELKRQRRARRKAAARRPRQREGWLP
jgi:hypothetical protein